MKKNKLDSESSDATEDRPRTKVRVRLDEDIIDYFKSIKDYEEMMNLILRSHLEASKAAR